MVEAQIGGPFLKDTTFVCCCSCGQKVRLSAIVVLRGDNKSCGCLSRKLKPLLPGSVFNQLTVLEWQGKMCLCRCACGVEKSVDTKSLKSGNTKSCGCARVAAANARAQDHTGEQYGSLTLLKRVDGRHWLCRCACGTEKIIGWGAIQGGATRSCGCLRSAALKERSEKPVRVGEVFGRLTVMAYLGKRCQCRCVCGKECTVMSTKLRTGRTKSCGCLQRERAGSEQIEVIKPGSVFGRITVLEQVRGTGGTECHGRCACGSVAVFSSKKLRTGHTQSCGCLKSEVWKETGRKVMAEGLSLARYLYTQYKNSATSRKVEFTLSREDVRRFIRLPCRYCGRVPADEHDYNGLDRLKNDTGYTPENVVACCIRCNRAKYQLSETDFLVWASRVTGGFSVAASSSLAPSGVRALYLHYVQQARVRKKTFDLTEEQVGLLVSSVCRYCGQVPSAVFAGKYVYTGIDRLNNDLGYSWSNCGPACKVCNRAKGQQTEAEFLSWVRRVVNFEK